MKSLKMIIIALMIIVLAGCDTGPKGIEMKPLDPVEREEQEDKDEEFTEVEVEDNNTEGSTVDEAEPSGIEETDADTEEANTDTESEESDTEEESELTNNDQEEEEILTPDEYSVLETIEVEDENEYLTGLVFVLQEGDIWRVVDRLGNVYRVSTSNESVVQGIVNVDATVTRDEEGNAKVSLSRDYNKYHNYYVVETEDDIARDFSTGLLEMQLNASDSAKIDSYTINTVTSEKIGKGIRVITMNFDVVPNAASTVWGSTQEVKNNEYSYTVYGYETTWILPVKAPLFKDVVMNDSVDSTDNSDQETDEEASDNESSDNQDDSSNNDGSPDNDSNSGVFNASDNQTLLADIGGKIYYSEKELLPQTDQYEGTDIYEHIIRLYVYDSNTGNSRQIVKGDKNGNYSLNTIYENKMFLVVMEQTPSAGGSLVGLSYVDLDDLSYRSIYKGQVAKGITVGDKSYIFTNDNLVEIDLVNASIRISSNLPKHLEFDINSVKVISLEENLMTVEISYEAEAVTYTINVINGETTVIDSFTF